MSEKKANFTFDLSVDRFKSKAVDIDALLLLTNRQSITTRAREKQRTSATRTMYVEVLEFTPAVRGLYSIAANLGPRRASTPSGVVPPAEGPDSQVRLGGHVEHPLESLGA